LFVWFVAGIQLMRYFKRFFIRRFANVTIATMRRMIYNFIMHKNTGELEKENTGNLMTRAVSDVDICEEGMRKFSTEVFDTGVLMVSYVIVLFAYDAKITLLSILFMPAAMLLAEALKKTIYRYSSAYRKKSGEVADLTFDQIDNSMLYRVTGMETKNRQRYERQLDDLETSAIKANILENSMQPIYNAIGMIGILIVVYLGGNKTIEGGWTVGVFSTYSTMFIALALKASKASKLFNSVQKSQVSWKRIKPYLGEYVAKDETLDLPSGKTVLEASGLSLRYDPAAEDVISNISFSGKQGEIIGITGQVASGKTTLGLALTGMYPYTGSIKINGKELKEYSEYERSAMIAYLGHQPQLFSDTIYENIALGEELDLDPVLKDVCLDEDLKDMPQGSGTLVGNAGIRLSGGQQARVALARALVKKPKIIILDDPFSAIDMKTEQTIIKNLKSRYQESLIILISHRLAVFSKTNQIILLDNDKTAEYGTHEGLLKSSRLYSSIYRLQALGEGGSDAL
ncbi:MAG TPA: ABC transporter ATP-binding protein, partial [Acholeplasmatales bacterium]|nr:ABC transporter ATP-binding protein [Acholeplasmatales bacterium]